MAPEMLVMVSQPRNQCKGYTNSVDWYSLGATIFKLLVGWKPFDSITAESQALYADDIKKRAEALGWTSAANPQLYALLHPLAFPDHLSVPAIDLISRLLDVDPATRLGAGKSGFRDIRDHEFFASISWERLEQKHVVPPYLPEKMPIPEEPRYESFDSMLRCLGRDSWVDDTIDPESDKRFFGNW